MQTRFRQAAKGMRFLFAAQIAALVGVVPVPVLRLSMIGLVLLLQLVGLKIASQTHSGYLAALRGTALWGAALLLSGAVLGLSICLPEAVGLPLVYLYMLCASLSELLWCVVQVLTLHVTSGLLRAAGEERLTRGTGLCGRGLLVLAACRAGLGVLEVLCAAAEGAWSRWGSGVLMVSSVAVGIGILGLCTICVLLLHCCGGVLKRRSMRVDGE